MTTTIVSADNIGTNLTYIFGDSSDIFVLAAGTRLIGDGYSYLYGTVVGIDVTIDGYLWLQGDGGGAGAPFYFTGGDRITVGADAQIVLTSSNGNDGFGQPYCGIMLGQGLGAGRIGGTDFSNAGQITLQGGGGFVALGGNNAIRNHGTIDVTTGSFTYGEGGNDTLLNAGTITGASPIVNGLVNIAGDNNSLTNTGNITVANGTAIFVQSTGGVTRINNSGDIITGEGVGITGTAASIFLDNSGTISGRFAALNLSSAGDIVVNSGHLNGLVFLGDGADEFNGIGGTVTGSIIGGDGADTYYTSDSGLAIFENANNGADSVYATVNFRLAANIETLRLQGFAVSGIGNSLANLIEGNGADNRIWGLAGADSLLGLQGDDVMGGGDANDTLRGGDGDDWLRGGAAADSLSGGGDADTVTGGLGADSLSGGTGNDRFVFLRQVDSGFTTTTSDRIADFTRGQDVIDLFGIDARTTNAAPNDAFTFIGTAAFSNVAGQMRYGSAAGVTTVAMDVNGNGVADMTIRLTGTLALTAQDFIL